MDYVTLRIYNSQITKLMHSSINKNPCDILYSKSTNEQLSFQANTHRYLLAEMVSLMDSKAEDPEYHFSYSKCIEIYDAQINIFFVARCVAIDPFTDQIYVILATGLDGKETLLIYSQSGELLRSFSHEKLKHIYGMAIHKNNVYIVSGLSSFLHFKVADSMSLIRSKNDGGSGIGEFIEPRQLDISNEGDLFVADFINNRVQILDGNFQYKRHISHHSMLKPCDVKLTSDEVYVLGYSPELSTYCIHIFTHMGEKIHSFILNVKPQYSLSYGFCVDTYGNVVIFESGNSQIKFFTKEGILFQTMDTIPDISGYYKSLDGVAWMTNQKLVVVSKNMLEIYSQF